MFKPQTEQEIMIMTKIKKKDGKEYYQQNNQITKSSCNDGIDKNKRKKPHKVAKFCKMSRLKFFDLKFKPLSLLISS